MFSLRSVVKSPKSKSAMLGTDRLPHHTIHLRFGCRLRIISCPSIHTVSRLRQLHSSDAVNTHDIKVSTPSMQLNIDPAFYQSKAKTLPAEVTDQSSIDATWEEYIRAANDPNLSLGKDDYLAMYNTLSVNLTTFESVKRIQQVLWHIHQHGDMPDVFVKFCDLLIRAHLKHEDLDSAHLAFDSMLKVGYEPSLFTVSNLLNGIARYGSAHDANSLYKTLQRKHLFPEDNRAYERLIKVLGIDFGDVTSCNKIFNYWMKRYKLLMTKNVNLQPSISLYNLMLIIYHKACTPESAWSLYQQILEEDSGVKPSWKTYYTLIQTLQGMEMDTIKNTRITQLYNDMRESGIRIQASHYAAMGWNAIEAFNLLKKSKKNILNVHDMNTLMSSAVKMYQFDDVWTLYGYMTKKHTKKTKSQQGQPQLSPDVFTYGIIMNALIKDKKRPTSKVFDLYEDMKRSNIKADQVVYSCLLQACKYDGEMDKVISYMDEMQQQEVPLNAIIVSNLISLMNSKESTMNAQDMAWAKSMWDKLTSRVTWPDVITCNQYLTLLSRYAPYDEPTGYHEKETLSSNQQGNNLHLSGPPMSETVKQMMEIYRTMRQSKVKTNKPDFRSYSLLIKTMVDNRQMRHAMVVFMDAQEAHKNLGAQYYNDIMQGLLLENDLHPIMHLWQDMKLRRILPNRLTYELVLDACQQLSLVDPFTTILHQRELDRNRLDKEDLGSASLENSSQDNASDLKNEAKK